MEVASLPVIVCLLGLVALCHSSCYFKELVVNDLKSPPKGCVDQDGKHHDFGSEWEKDCAECFCSEEGTHCCSTIPEQTEVPEECELVVDKEACSAQVVMKSDKTKECEPV
ncbi:beta-microseminoprotein [Brachionichthys hirsutus]|uniref:beta-microseminoprotein n=1 Tax=Brachionichthys hirsutus TaxID=412623 RepID=UPI00360535FA